MGQVRDGVIHAPNRRIIPPLQYLHEPGLCWTFLVYS